VAFEIPTISYAGSIGTVVVGQGGKALTIGGQNCYPFHDFEGKVPHRPVIGMEVWDHEPEEWPAWVLEPFKDVAGDPAAWAKKCVDEYGALFIGVMLKSTDPNDKDASPEEAAATVKKVVEAVDVPVLIWGTANPEKDAAVLAAVAEKCEGVKLILGPVEEKNHKQVGAQALAYKHGIGANSPIDVNLAKQLNILLGNLGVEMENVIIDPTTGSLGYGLEYGYSVMERIRMAALTQEDDKLMLPLMNCIGPEVWKTKECKLTLEEAPELGDPQSRGVMMEAITAVSLLLAGSDMLLLRHPLTVKLVNNYLEMMIQGGASAAAERRPGQTAPPAVEMTPRQEAKAAAARPAPPPAAKPAPPPAAKPAPPVEAKPKLVVVKEEAAPAPPKEAPAAPASEEAAKAEAEAKAEAKAKAEAEAEAARKAAEEEAKRQAEAEAARKAEEAAAAEEAVRQAAEEDLAALRAARRAEREKHLAERGELETEVPLTPAEVQFDRVQKMIFHLVRTHKRGTVLSLEVETAALAQKRAEAPAPKAKTKTKAKAKPKAKPKTKK